MNQPPLRICVQWPRFGPYHLARLRNAHAVLSPRGAEVIGLETAGEDTLYDWRVEREDASFRREQVFPNRAFETVTPTEMHTATLAALDQLNPDAVGIMSYGYPDARAALAWCRRRRRVAVLMTDTKADDAERVGWREAVKRTIVAQYDAALAAGSPHRAYLLRLGFPENSIFFGYDVVDNEFFRAGAEAARRHPDAHRNLPGLDSEVPFFLASNRFLPRKNLERLLWAYARYRREAADPWRLLMLGDGALRPDLTRLIAEHNIEGVVLCGFRQIEELPAYYGLASAFVHPALVDQWALVVNEAMAAGLPVIVSTGAGCAADLIKEGQNGFRFDPHDETALTHCMLQLSAAQTDHVAMGRRSLDIIARWPLERFSEGLWEACQAGKNRANRFANPLAQLLLTATNRLARDVRAFHSVEV